MVQTPVLASICVFMQMLMSVVMNSAEAVDSSLIMALSYLLVLGAVVIDTITGVAKAHRIGRKIESSILRRVFGKLLVYYGLILMFTFLDILLFLVDIELRLNLPELPYLTTLGCIGAIATEGWSVWENMPRHDTESIKRGATRSRELMRELAKAVREIDDVKKLTNE